MDEMLQQSTGRAAATEHIARRGAATEHTEDNDGDDKQTDNQTEVINAPTDYASKPKKQLKKHDASYQVSLSQQKQKQWQKPCQVR